MVNNFPYTTNVPFEDDDPSENQPDMKENTNSLSSILNVDMVGFNQDNSGYHRQLTFVTQGSDPGSVSGNYVEYAKSSGGATELFAQKDGNVTPIQLTRNVPTTNSNGSVSYLPGGFLVQWGSKTASGNLATVTFPIPFTSNPTSLTATVRNLAGVFHIASVQPPSNTGAVFNVSGAGQTIYWLAIGV